MTDTVVAAIITASGIVLAAVVGSLIKSRYTKAHSHPAPPADTTTQITKMENKKDDFEPNAVELSMLQFISKYTGDLYVCKIAVELHLEQQKALYCFERLSKAGLVRLSYECGDALCKLSHEGREFLVKRKLL